MTENRKLANDLRNWLLDHDMWSDVSIFFDGCVYGTKDPKTGKHHCNDPVHLIEYNGNPGEAFQEQDSVTLTFGESLYNLLNYSGYPLGMIRSFDAVFEKHGFEYEMGRARSIHTRRRRT